MFESIKNHFRKGQALSEVARSFKYIHNHLNEIDNKTNEDAITSILFLYYYFNLEISEKCDHYDLGFNIKLFGSGIGDKSWVTLGYALAQTISRFDEPIIRYNLQKELNEILEKGSLYYEMEELYSRIKIEANV